ncbi:D-aminoacyl-tRNA deacylase [Methylacidimicrobium cyclopophantes]|uniref:D-aminoacyl-tRNA deacylase n=1 Tax=Methylacidimicrobium cyclopophantes TaxID=1041766 RepID=A0A5E6MJ71_9BACT|nr:D-aminoacyl-tRNA deacylase [Methylacidimicrobium cyclopophantes]VVM05552.1 D-aminoacyl-tRNA deacylase [Methylacidimicrobium cyclopophantes]
MIALIQRVREARVSVRGETVAEIGVGILGLVAVEQGDQEAAAERLLGRILDYRIFPDEAGRMGRSLRDVGGGLLLVPQFTLAADTRKGSRPSFSPAAAAEVAQALFSYLVERARERYGRVACGLFGAEMEVALVNAGPVTFWLRASPKGVP